MPFCLEVDLEQAQGQREECGCICFSTCRLETRFRFQQFVSACLGMSCAQFLMQDVLESCFTVVEEASITVMLESCMAGARMQFVQSALCCVWPYLQHA